MLTNRKLGNQTLHRVDRRDGHEDDAEDDDEKVEEDGALAERLLEAVVVQQRGKNHTHRRHHQSSHFRQRNPSLSSQDIQRDDLLEVREEERHQRHHQRLQRANAHSLCVGHEVPLLARVLVYVSPSPFSHNSPR